MHVDESDTSVAYPTGLYVVDLASGARRQLARGFALGPDWSPRGDYVAYAMGGIRLVNLRTGTDSILIPFQAYFPAFSPDGSSLAFDTPHDDPRGASAIWLVSLDGSAPKDISQHGGGEWRDPDWSADRHRLVHVRFPGVGSGEIYVMDSLGTAAQRLTRDDTSDGYPAWSPDGALLAWTRLANGPAPEVWLMRPDGSDQRRLVRGEYPAWSPTSQELAFVDPKAPVGAQLVRIRVDGSQRHIIPTQ
jgi:TolB protein